MLHATTLAGFDAGGQEQWPPLKSILTHLGLTTNLRLCLDTADFFGGQKWRDTSGNGYDFFLGADGTAGADDPAIVQNVARAWSFDGGDLFTYDSANEAWMENLHKDNAILSLIAFYYQDGAGDSITFLASSGATTDIGVAVGVATAVPFIRVDDGVAPSALGILGDTGIGAASWHMAGFSLTEATGAGGGFLFVDGAYNQVGGSDTFTSTYNSPSAAAATNTVLIGGQGTIPATSDGQRLACLAVWEGTALTKANMDSIWSAMRGRFGL